MSDSPTDTEIRPPIHAAIPDGEVDEIRKDALAALEPFAKSYDATVMDGRSDDDAILIPLGMLDDFVLECTIGDLRRAAKAYEALRANSSDVSVPRVTDEMVTEIMKRLGSILNDLAFVYGDESEAGEAVRLFRRLHSALQTDKPSPDTEKGR